ncbi:hypothetical protein AB1N83_008356 [Pleurotus pulmonarius]
MAPPESKPEVQHLTLLEQYAYRQISVVVANIVGLQRKETSICYDLDDGTWNMVIRGRRWSDKGADTDELENLQYVRVLGRLQHFTISPGNTYKSITIETIRPIEGPHEVLYHILQTMVEPLVAVNPNDVPWHDLNRPQSPDGLSTRRSESPDQTVDQDLARETQRLEITDT